MKSRSKSKSKPNSKATKLRIIGGDMGGRTVTYHGEEFTRPMRDSVRENLFNILGRGVRGTTAFDLFAGTGVLAFEAISRGAIRAVAVEPMKQAVNQIRKTVEHLDLDSKFKLVQADAFAVANRLLSCDGEDDTPWIVFLSPPYRFWNDPEMYPKLAAIIRHVQRHAPPGSILVAETDYTFDTDLLPAGDWDIRAYGITRLAFIEPGNHCGMSLPDTLEL
ncbi:RsmD family RNA methyltransferase [Allorhodopirellula heiligendammensis]|uniref:Ribosomal RNA small subunit methyltransferase D n=1 Tax=Allorhodopirellula heiligendammensis TaxID=2714739 RepID=A0A5C6BY52_9BACT|nr:RsmD family RNA methyltransferase [Allorhodopirellula heiligendammensis]TWU15764.1 Ribosomal RNA small subunit methyltransferase D [Allorhodopirellula heiligendammensis]